MARNRSRAHNKPSGSKSQVHKKILCYVCYTSKSSRLFSTKYCSSSVTHKVCDTCLHQHIVSTLDSCLTNRVTCPQFDCRAIISLSVIRDILLKYNNNDLLNNYLRVHHWQGKRKSEEWIKLFTLRCPGCNIPIEKIGGCDRMVCSRCKKCFYWSKANVPNENHALIDEDTYVMIGFVICVFILAFVGFYCILK